MTRRSRESDFPSSLIIIPLITSGPDVVKADLDPDEGKNILGSLNFYYLLNEAYCYFLNQLSSPQDPNYNYNSQIRVLCKLEQESEGCVLRKGSFWMSLYENEEIYESRGVSKQTFIRLDFVVDPNEISDGRQLHIQNDEANAIAYAPQIISIDLGASGTRKLDLVSAEIAMGQERLDESYYGIKTLLPYVFKISANFQDGQQINFYVLTNIMRSPDREVSFLYRYECSPDFFDKLAIANNYKYQSLGQILYQSWFVVFDALSRYLDFEILKIEEH